ncbi:armadillo-type protein [Hysterangium stoloniferum]|nr:armadillo-type protein [Hysterangium stoloniferum]
MDLAACHFVEMVLGMDVDTFSLKFESFAILGLQKFVKDDNDCRSLQKSQIRSEITSEDGLNMEWAAYEDLIIYKYHVILDAEFRPAISNAILDIVALLKDTGEFVCSDAAWALAKLSEQSEFRAAVSRAIPDIVALLKNTDVFVSSNAASTLAKLSDQAEFRPAIVAAIPDIVILLRDLPRDQSNIASALAKLSEYGAMPRIWDVSTAEFRAAISSVISDIDAQVKDTEAFVRSNGVSTLAKLSEQDGVPHIGTDTDNLVHSSAALALAKFSQKAEFRPAILSAIPDIVALLKHADAVVRSNGVLALAKLSEQAEFQAAVSRAIPDIVALLKDPGCYRRPNVSWALAKLSDQAEFRSAIAQAIPSIVKPLEDMHPFNARHVVDLLVKLAAHGYFSNLKLQIVLTALCQFNLPEPPLLHRGTLIQILLKHGTPFTGPFGSDNCIAALKGSRWPGEGVDLPV